MANRHAPRLNDLVHYVVLRDQVPLCRGALVVLVEHPIAPVTLAVFDPAGIYFIHNAVKANDDGPGTWHQEHECLR